MKLRSVTIQMFRHKVVGPSHFYKPPSPNKLRMLFVRNVHLLWLARRVNVGGDDDLQVQGAASNE
jgi:hypothetical protein